MPSPGPGSAPRRTKSSAPRLTIRGSVFLLSAVALFAIARIFGVREIVFAACLLLIMPLLGLILITLRRPQLRVVRRTDPELIEAGKPASVQLTFENLASLATPTARWVDPIDEREGPGMPAVLPPIPGFRRTVMQNPPAAQVGYELASPVRGVHRFGPVEVRLGDPFGMVSHTLELGDRERVTITPRVWPITRTAAELVPGVGNDKYAGRLGPAGEVDVLARKYQTGDSMRRVNWPATARYGELMVRQDDQHGAKDATVILDTDPASFPGTHEDLVEQDDIEWGVSAACSVALHILGEGYTLAFAGAFDAGVSRRTRVRTYSPGDESLLLVDAATVRRSASDASDDVSGLLEAIGGTQSGRTVLAVLGARSRPSRLPELPPGTGLAIIVLPSTAGSGTQAALDLERQLASQGWRVRLAATEESFTGIWQDLAGRGSRV